MSQRDTSNEQLEDLLELKQDELILLQKTFGIALEEARAALTALIKDHKGRIDPLAREVRGLEVDLERAYEKEGSVPTPA